MRPTRGGVAGNTISPIEKRKVGKDGEEGEGGGTSSQEPAQSTRPSAELPVLRDQPKQEFI